METFSKDVAPRELEEVLRLEYRSKLLNPKWAQARCPARPLDIPTAGGMLYCVKSQHLQAEGWYHVADLPSE